MRASTKLEAKLFAVTLAFLILCFGFSVYAVYGYGIDLPTCIDMKPFTTGQLIERAPRRYEVHYVAKMWAFDPTEITVPLGSELDIYLSSSDVTHGFYIPGTNANLMAVPGSVNYTRVTFNRPGRYPIVCHEYCGIAHHNMAAFINVTESPTTPPKSDIPGIAPTDPVAASAQALLQVKACLGCHSVDGSPSVGPTFKGLFKREEHFADGSEVHVDEEYVRESIVNPRAKIVSGFEDVMPVVPLTESELNEIIAYLKTL